MTAAFRRSAGRYGEEDETLPEQPGRPTRKLSLVPSSETPFCYPAEVLILPSQEGSDDADYDIDDDDSLHQFFKYPEPLNNDPPPLEYQQHSPRSAQEFHQPFDDLLVEEMSLAGNELERIEHNKHNDGCQDNPEYVQERLQALDRAIDEMPRKEAYQEAERMDYDYVNDPHLRWTFLQAESFDAYRAAARFVKFLEGKLKYQGHWTSPKASEEEPGASPVRFLGQRPSMDSFVDAGDWEGVLMASTSEAVNASQASFEFLLFTDDQDEDENGGEVVQVKASSKPQSAKKKKKKTVKKESSAEPSEPSVKPKKKKKKKKKKKTSTMATPNQTPAELNVDRSASIEPPVFNKVTDNEILLTPDTPKTRNCEKGHRHDMELVHSKIVDALWGDRVNTSPLISPATDDPKFEVVDTPHTRNEDTARKAQPFKPFQRVWNRMNGNRGRLRS